MAIGEDHRRRSSVFARFEVPGVDRLEEVGIKVAEFDHEVAIRRERDGKREVGEHCEVRAVHRAIVRTEHIAPVLGAWGTVGGGREQPNLRRRFHRACLRGRAERGAAELEFAGKADSVRRQAECGEGDDVVHSDALLMAVGPSGCEAAVGRSRRDEHLLAADVGEDGICPYAARVVDRRIVVRGGHVGFVVVGEIEVDTLAELAHVGHTGSPYRCLLRSLEDGEQDRGENRDDRDDHEEFDEREG